MPTILIPPLSPPLGSVGDCMGRAQFIPRTVENRQHGIRVASGTAIYPAIKLSSVCARVDVHVCMQGTELGCDGRDGLGLGADFMLSCGLVARTLTKLGTSDSGLPAHLGRAIVGASDIDLYGASDLEASGLPAFGLQFSVVCLKSRLLGFMAIRRSLTAEASSSTLLGLCVQVLLVSSASCLRPLRYFLKEPEKDRNASFEQCQQ